MGMNFPDLPTNGQVFGVYTYDGEKWVMASSPNTAAPSNSNPLMEGVAAPGVTALYSRGDHVHPVDTSIRPIVAGGTGANNAHDAMIALSGEIAKQGPVTNLDTFAFINGSFFGNGSATGAPTTNAFVGEFYEHSNPAYATMTVWDVFDPLNTSYTRLKAGGTWNAWKQNIGTQADADARYVNLTGDTMTGGLAITTATPSLALNKSTGTYAAGITSSSGGVPRWGMFLGDYGDASDFSLYRYNDAGAYVDKAFTISRADATARFTGSVYGGASKFTYLTTSVSATTGFLSFGDSGTKYINYDGTTFFMNGGPLVVTTAAGYGNISGGDYFSTRAGAPTQGIYFFGNTGSKYLQFDGSSFALVGAATFVVGSPQVIQPPGLTPGSYGQSLNIAYHGANAFGIGLRTGVDGSRCLTFFNAASTEVGSVSQTATVTAYNTSSGAELKEDLKSFDAGNIIDDTKVYDFKWKSTGERAYGVIAQQAAEVYPLAVTHSTKIDAEGRDVGDDFWGVDYSKYVPVLLQELKALRARVADLEGRIDTKPQPA